MAPLGMRYSLGIGLDNFPQRDVFVAVAGLGVFLRDGQLDGLVGAGVGTGQARWTAPGRMHCPAAHHMNRTGRTHLLTNSAAYAAFRHTQQVLPRVRRHPAHAAQEFLMGCPILVCHRGNPMPAAFYIRQDTDQLIFYLFIQLFLLLHVKAGKPVIYHQHHIDIGGLNAALPVEC